MSRFGCCIFIFGSLPEIVRFVLRGGNRPLFLGSCESVESLEPSLDFGLAVVDLSFAISAPLCGSVADACVRDFRKGAMGGSAKDAWLARVAICPSTASSADKLGGVSINDACEIGACAAVPELALFGRFTSPTPRPFSAGGFGRLNGSTDLEISICGAECGCSICMSNEAVSWWCGRGGGAVSKAMRKDAAR